MDITVVICTYNRAQSLRTTLESVTDLDRSANFSWEVIVVDNNSNDQTRDVVFSFINDRKIDLVYHFEGQQGHSFARNAGVRRARGRIVAFTDDDVVVDRHWLNHISEAFQNQDVAVVGGPILPIWPAPPPCWLTENLHGNLALLDYGNEDMFLDHDALWGANLAIRRAALEAHGMFDTSLGRTSGKLTCGEETDLISKIRRSGGRLRYCAGARVFHRIGAERVKKRYFRRWRKDNGELAGIRFAGPVSRSVLGIPLYIIRMFLEAFWVAVVARVRGDGNAFEKELETYHHYAFIVGRLKKFIGRVVSG